uniref:Uncharacterized protein n=1 Tax=Timema douglasi TaxID=61478 RepID=A0A7R8ZA37_TIMDO|nr:unnamed protein product [Timema douglasi]
MRKREREREENVWLFPLFDDVTAVLAVVLSVIVDLISHQPTRADLGRGQADKRPKSYYPSGITAYLHQSSKGEEGIIRRRMSVHLIVMDQHPNLDLPVLSSRAQHDKRVSQLRHRASVKALKMIDVKERLPRAPARTRILYSLVRCHGHYCTPSSMDWMMSRGSTMSENKQNTEEILQPGVQIRPIISPKEVSEIVQRLYGLRNVQIDELNAYDDKNYYIQVDIDHQSGQEQTKSSEHSRSIIVQGKRAEKIHVCAPQVNAQKKKTTSLRKIYKDTWETSGSHSLVGPTPGTRASHPSRVLTGAIYSHSQKRHYYIHSFSCVGDYAHCAWESSSPLLVRKNGGAYVRAHALLTVQVSTRALKWAHYTTGKARAPKGRNPKSRGPRSRTPPVSSEYNDTFNPDGYVFKVMNSLDSQKHSFIEAQNELLMYLGSNGINCPKPVKNVDGLYYSVEQLPKNGSANSICDALSRLPTEVDGVTFSEEVRSPEDFMVLAVSLGGIPEVEESLPNLRMLQREDPLADSIKEDLNRENDLECKENLKKATEESCLRKVQSYVEEVDTPEAILAEHGTQFTSKMSYNVMAALDRDAIQRELTVLARSRLEWESKERKKAQCHPASPLGIGDLVLLKEAYVSDY